METSGEDDKEVIKCLLCQGDVEEAEMIDHIASKHLGYTLHRCEGCDFGCHNAEKALEHAQETRHPVMLNKCWYNSYTEELVKKAYEDSIAASAVKKEEAEKVPSAQVSTQKKEASSTQAEESSSTQVEEASSTQAEESSSTQVEEASSTQVEELYEDQCHECLAVVPNQGKRDHVWNEHLHTTAICPVLGCSFTVTSNFAMVSGTLGTHVNTEHAMSIDEKAAYRKGRKERRCVADSVYRNCFPCEPMKKSKVIDSDREHSDRGGGDAGSKQKAIKRD